jgi:chemotaxis protein CheX
MKAEFINPFIESTLNVLSTMAQTKATAGAPALKQNKTTWGEVSGVIGMAGHNISGNMIISFDEPCILSIVSKMLMEEFKEITPDVVDAVGEITNMITGGTKKLLSAQGFSFEMAIPITIKGKGIELSQLSSAPIISIPFKTDSGTFVVEANLSPRKTQSS